jgi:benzoyl-CoA reductase subunit C
MTAKSIIPELSTESLDELLWSARELLENDTYPTVARWREGGGKVVGHFQVYFPDEIAHAAGALPFRMRGAPVEPLQSDSRFGSYLCSILKTSLEIALTGRVELDLFVTHPICDAARNMAGIFGRNFDYPCQILYLPQNPHSSHTVAYLRGEYARLQRVIEKATGNTVTKEALRSSIEVYNHNRKLLKELYTIKRETPWQVSADEAYALMALGGVMRREDHNAVLETALLMIHGRSVNRPDRIRVVYEGGFCEQPPLDLIRAVARSCYVVDDDLLIGMRWILHDVPVTGDLLTNMAEAYIEDSSYSPVQHDNRKKKEEMLIERIRSSGAEAAIVTAAKMCEPGLEEQVAYTRRLDEAEIPYFVSEFEENMTSFDHLEIQLETFVENLMFD